MVYDKITNIYLLIQDDDHESFQEIHYKLCIISPILSVCLSTHTNKHTEIIMKQYCSCLWNYIMATLNIYCFNDHNMIVFLFKASVKITHYCKTMNYLLWLLTTAACGNCLGGE